MHAALARVVTPDTTYYPANVYEVPGSDEVLLDTKAGERLRTMTGSHVEMASPDARMTFNVSRAWWVQGTVDGQPETWLVLAVGGCGCGNTGGIDTTDSYAAWLALAPTLA
jgi:hypothetical protein